MSQILQQWVKNFQTETEKRFGLSVKCSVDYNKTDFTVLSKQITSIVADAAQIEYDSIIAQQRGKRNISDSRAIAMYFIRHYTGAGFKRIGDFFGGRDHSSVVISVKNVEAWIETKDQIAAPIINEVAEKIKTIFKTNL